MPSDLTQPEETELEDESPEDEAQRSAEHWPYHATNVPTVEPTVTEEESRLTEEYGERGESPDRN